MFSPEERKKIAEAWQSFAETGQAPADNLVREVIHQSWVRSRHHGVDPRKMKKKIISPEELAWRIRRRSNLLEIARPYMQKLYNFVQGSGYLVILTDEKGYILEVIGDRDAQEQAAVTKLVVGANRSEEQAGTNAIGTCLYLNQPMQVWAEEHYFISHHHWTCSAAPICNTQGELLGCLDISGPWDKVHAHTLGMVVAAVYAIESEIRVRQAYEEIFLTSSRLKATLESISEGIIVIDAQGIVRQVNREALRMLGLEEGEIIRQPIREVLRCDDYFSEILQSGINVSDQEQVFRCGWRNLHFAVTTATTATSRGNHDSAEGLVITLRELKDVHKLINKMTGSQAHFTFNSIIGHSEAMQEAIRLARIAARSSSNVLLLGESGTGKELFAQAIHNSSPRGEGPFIAINCGALPRGLIESELFGYEGGAFTGSRKEGHPGKFELADGGTIFLDEIGDMPLEVQISLLRVLQNKVVVRVGGNREKKVDVRIIAATNKNIAEAVANHTFREDLYYRLNVLSINIPPLRERKEDISLLADYFLKKYNNYLEKVISSITPEARDVLAQHHWPGNVRELENVIERAINLAQGKNIGLRDLPLQIRDYGKAAAPARREERSSCSIKELERQAILEALERWGGNVTKAAEDLGMSRRTLYRRLKEYFINI